MQNKFKVITLCSSTKFKNEFIKMSKKLTLEGNIILLPVFFEHSGDDKVLKKISKDDVIDVKNILDEMHRTKIDMSDEIFVINVNGYIGESTKSEIEYAKQNGTKVEYLVNPIIGNLIGKKVRHKCENTIYTVKDVITFGADTFGQGDFAVITREDGKYLYECEIEIVD